ncbi:hypothetical protein [Paenibacillus sp. ACRRY]|uniref:hypothetical protein n=1 Tax=Paenibacillus sp. ACRRY TaxID=2918208 RepID=UPI001EF4EAC9|nr:hypothetical protein [Paenibacillus sp. ACRRY]MCG7381934.1 hypothetical protein [Paenibacillus sp. ACRRY]
MNKRYYDIFSVVLTVLLLQSACAASDGESMNNPSHTHTNSNTPAIQIPAATHAANKEERLIDPEGYEFKEIGAEDFKKGVFIDFERYKKNFFNDDIISKFKGNLEGIVENDIEKFKIHLYEGSQKESLFFHEENVQYMFNDLDLLEKIIIDGREQIRIGVQYAKNYSDGTVENKAITYFFTENKEGEWRIENID